MPAIKKWVEVEDYEANAVELAAGFIDEFVGQIAERLLSGRDHIKHVDDLLGGDRHFSECTVGDVGFDLRDSVEVLEQLSQWKETDPSFWEGKEPKDGLCSIADRTFENVVRAKIGGMLKKVSEEWDEGELLERLGVEEVTPEQSQAEVKRLLGIE